MQKRHVFTTIIVLSLSASIVLGNGFSDGCSFVKRFCENPSSVGSLWPSSSVLAKSITKHINEKNIDLSNMKKRKATKKAEEKVKEKTLNLEDNKPIRILEVGAGTGVFTKQIVKKLSSIDTLDVIEIDTVLCDILNEKFEDYDNVYVNSASILDWDPKEKYDYIVSGLPFNSFEPNLVREILEKYKNLIKVGGEISFFEYMWLPTIKKFFLNLSPERKKKYAEILSAVSDFKDQFETEKDNVLRNFTPAYVYYLKAN